MKGVASGISGATPIWRKILLEALDGKPNVTFEEPSGLVTASVDMISGYKAHDNLPERTEVFVKGTEPTEDTVHKMVPLCKGEGKLARPSDIAANDVDYKEFFYFEEMDPTAAAGATNLWQEGINKWLETQADSKYHPPTEYCGGSNRAPINIEFSEPKDRNSDLDNDVKVKFIVDSVYNITEAWIELDGNRIRSFTSMPYEHTMVLEDGAHKIRAAAKDEKGNESERIITIGVNIPWDQPSPTSTPTSTP